MSFLTRTTPVLRQAAVISQAPRCFSTAIAHQKSVTDSAKDGLKKVDRAVSDTIVAGIDKGVEAKDKAAAAAGVETKKAEGEASAMAGQAKGKASEVAGQAKGKAEEMKGKMS